MTDFALVGYNKHKIYAAVEVPGSTHSLPRNIYKENIPRHKGQLPRC